MSDSDVTELLKLPAEEKLRVIELLWESLSASASALPLSDAHRAAIDEALAEHRQAPDDVLTLEQVLSGVEGRDAPAVPRATRTTLRFKY